MKPESDNQTNGNSSEAAPGSKQDRPAGFNPLSCDRGCKLSSPRCQLCRAALESAPTGIPRLQIDNMARDRLAHRIQDIHWDVPETMQAMPEAAAEAARILEEEIPRLRGFLNQLLDDRAAPAVFLSNLPVGSEHVATLVALGLSLLYGHAFQYLGQNGSELVARLEPKPEFEGQGNTGEGRGDFLPHSDDAILAPEFSTDWIQLLGVVNECRAATAFTPIDAVVASLTKESRRILAEPRFIFHAPKSFRLRMKVSSLPTPVLFELPDGAQGVRLSTYNCQPAEESDSAASGALAEIIGLVHCPEFSHELVIGSGDCLIFTNNRGLHSRKAIEGRRLVLRTYVKNDLSLLQSKSLSDGPVFDPWSLMR